jgi:cytoskeletal protein CcmA (bactofilin family)
MTITKGTDENVTLVAGEADIEGNIKENAIISAGHLQLDSAIGRNAVVLAGQADLKRHSDINRNTVIIAGNTTLSGHYRKNVMVIAGNVTIAGEIDGNANIIGKLNYISPNAVDVSKGANIRGKIHPWKMRKDQQKSQFQQGGYSSYLMNFTFEAGLFLLGTIIVLFMPALSRNIIGRLMKKPGYSLLTGIVTLLIVPVIGYVSLFIYIGLPLFVVLTALYIALLVLAYIFTALEAGALLLKLIYKPVAEQYRGWLVLALALGLTLLYLVSLIPYIGFWILFIAFLLGLGSLTLYSFKCCLGEKQAT